MTRTRTHGGGQLAILILVMVVLALLPRSLRAGELSKDSQACVKCHDRPDLATTLDDGSRLSLHVSAQGYLASVHKDQDCTDCHSQLDDKTHGKGKTTLESHRALTAAMQDSCRDCHKKKFKQYDDSIHAALVKAGDTRAPLCASCHDAHTQAPVKQLASIDHPPCATCHEAIFKAWSGDVHGQLRASVGRKAPICADCHQAHDIRAASLGHTTRDACLGCHQDAEDKHRAWLPNTALHLDAIACPACHNPAAERRVNLRLVDAASGTQLREQTGVPRFAQRASASDAGPPGLDDAELQALLTQFSADLGGPRKVAVHGRLEVKSGVQAHQIAVKARALKDCDTCHRAGAAAFHSVSITIAGADGRPLRHAVNKEVLGSLGALDSVRGFYAIGSTRVQLLDVLLVLVVGGALAGALGHMMVKRLAHARRAQQDKDR
ncbi:MAG: hypothetical protein RLZZ584_2445 [Pseudomonadota bacterium]|jgi:hypothetical protein